MPRDARRERRASRDGDDGRGQAAAARARFGLPGRVGRAGSEEASGCGARVGFRLKPAGAFDRFGAIQRRHHVLELELLLCGERQQLVRRLSDLKRAFGALAA